MEKLRGFEVVADQFRKHPDIEIQVPRRADPQSCASDIYSPISTILKPGERVLIWTDIKAYMQNNEVVLGNVRSSHGKPLVRLANTQGWIDASYYENPKNDGNIGIYISNEGEDRFDIKEGDRIAQLMFINYLVPDNDDPMFKERLGGFGSSDERKSNKYGTKFNVGDQVKVRKDLKLGEIYGMESGSYKDSFVHPMDEYMGETVTIREIYADSSEVKYYRIVGDYEYNWTDKMFE